MSSIDTLMTKLQSSVNSAAPDKDQDWSEYIAITIDRFNALSELRDITLQAARDLGRQVTLQTQAMADEVSQTETPVMDLGAISSRNETSAVMVAAAPAARATGRGRVDPAMALDRVARALRLTIGLELKLEADLRAALIARDNQKAEAEHAALTAARDEADVQSENRRQSAVNILLRVCDAEFKDGEDRENYGQSAYDMLYGDHAFSDQDDCCMQDLVERLAAALEIKIDWDLWREDDEDFVTDDEDDEDDEDDALADAPGLNRRE